MSEEIGQPREAAAEKGKDYLGRAPVGKLLLKLAIPTVVAQLINMLYNLSLIHISEPTRP